MARNFAVPSVLVRKPWVLLRTRAGRDLREMGDVRIASGWIFKEGRTLSWRDG